MNRETLTPAPVERILLHSTVKIAALIKLTEFRQDQWRHDRVQEEFNRRLIQARKVFPAS
jgi:hypothetical protein